MLNNNMLNNNVQIKIREIRIKKKIDKLEVNLIIEDQIKILKTTYFRK